jgi:CTP synthase
MPEKSVRIGLVGKCMSRKDAYRSIFEALTHAGIANNCRIETVVVDAEDLEKHTTEVLKSLDGILIPAGFGDRGTEGKILAAKYARENNIPYLEYAEACT